MPDADRPFSIHSMCEREGTELSNVLLENTCATYLLLEMEKYTESSAEAMAKYVRASKHLQRIRCNVDLVADHHRLRRQCPKILCCFLPAIQERSSLKELNINFPLIGRPSHLALKNILTHTQS
jgi:hypothetical protein